MRRSILLACVAALVTSSFTLSACATGANAYVALGDSYTAGTLIPNTAPEPESFGCMRSDHNYPHLVRRQIDLRVFADVSCSGAKTDNMLLQQQEPLDSSRSNPPQFDALEGRRARAVTITIGGNDAGIGDLISGPGCTSPTNPASNTPCQDEYVVNGHDRLSDRIAASGPKVLRVLEGIHSRAPRATVFLLNYLDIVPPDGTTDCSIFEGGDIKWFNAREVELNTMLKTQAKAANAAATSANEKPYVVYVDAYRGSIGHDACQPAATRWIEPRTNALAYQLHPNATGMAKGYAEPLLAAMRAAGIAP